MNDQGNGIEVQSMTTMALFGPWACSPNGIAKRQRTVVSRFWGVMKARMSPSFMNDQKVDAPG